MYTKCSDNILIQYYTKQALKIAKALWVYHLKKKLAIKKKLNRYKWQQFSELKNINLLKYIMFF